MDTSDGECQGHKPHKIKRSTSSKSSVKSKNKEIRSQSFDQVSSHSMEALTSQANGYSDDPTTEDTNKHTASIKGMWKKAFKSLKSNDKQTWLSKKGNKLPRKDSQPDGEKVDESSKDVDPVYSLLKCAAYLPKVPVKIQKEPMGCPHHVITSELSQSPSHHTSSQQSIESGQGGHRATSPISNREHMHHIVDESLGSEFRTFYKLTSPVRKQSTDGTLKKHSPNSSFDQY